MKPPPSVSWICLISLICSSVSSHCNSQFNLVVLLSSTSIGGEVFQDQDPSQSTHCGSKELLWPPVVELVLASQDSGERNGKRNSVWICKNKKMFLFV